MKVLQLGKFYPVRGGVEKVMWDLTAGLSDRGIECDMVCGALPGEASPGVVRIGDRGRCICLKSFFKLAGTVISPAMIVWVRKHCLEYDIVHIHHPDPMACLSLYLSGYKGRVVLHWHSDILSQKLLLVFYKPLQNWLIRRADRIVGTTPVYVAQSAALSGVQDKIFCLPIGIADTVRFSAEDGLSTKSSDGKKLVFSLGRLVPYKGFRYLVEAARFLPEEYEILIGGKGPLYSVLQKEIETLGVGDKVRLLGYLSDEQARRLYNECDVFVLSSTMKTEAFGIVQLEAMSCGKPVVATMIPESGTAWVNEHGVSGLNVAPADAKAIAEAVVAICADPDAYSGFSLGARRRFESVFTLDRMIDGALEIYWFLWNH